MSAILDDLCLVKDAYVQEDTTKAPRKAVKKPLKGSLEYGMTVLFRV